MIIVGWLREVDEDCHSHYECVNCINTKNATNDTLLEVNVDEFLTNASDDGDANNLADIPDDTILMTCRLV